MTVGSSAAGRGPPRPGGRSRVEMRPLVPIGPERREEVDDDRALRPGDRVVRPVRRIRQVPPGPRVRVSPSTVKVIVPVMTMPICSFSCRCSGTAASGASSTSARVTRSPLMDLAWTAEPQTSRGGTSSKSTRNDTAGSSCSGPPKSGTVVTARAGRQAAPSQRVRGDARQQEEVPFRPRVARLRGCRLRPVRAATLPGPGPSGTAGNAAMTSMPIRWTPRVRRRARSRRRRPRPPLETPRSAVSPWATAGAVATSSAG